jgi:amino acid transporter
MSKATEMSEASPPSEQSLRRNQLGTGNIVFLVLAAAAPMAAVVVTVPLSVGFGDGAGTPGAYLLAGVTLLLFAIGYVAMSRHIVNAGAFYAYVTKGLGRPLGMSTAMIAVLAYNAWVIAVVGIAGVFAHNVAAAELHVHWSWEVWSAIFFAIVATLSLFEIQLSARVLGVALLCEFAVLSIMSVGILVTQGPGAYTLHSFSPSGVFAGAAGVSVMYAFSSFVGFEATALYAEEAREPRRSVPRATYIAILIIAIFYALTTWSLIAGYGAGHAAAAANKDPAEFVFAANARYVGGFTVHAMNLLICTSLFAALLAFHNATARYMYALARDGILPRALARTHPRFGSPYVASAVQLTLTAAVVITFAALGLDPLLELGAAFLGLGTLGIIVLQGLASFSVVGFFRNRPDGHWWKTLVAPLLGGLGLSAATVLVIKNYSSLTGAKSDVINHLWVLVPAAVVLGLALAAWLRARRPELYAGFAEDRVDELFAEAEDRSAAAISPPPVSPIGG